MDIFGNEGGNPFDQDLNTTNAVDFTRVDVADAIIDNQQLATKLYVDTHVGSGNMSYIGTTPATNYIYKAASSDGKSATKSNIVDTGATVTVITTLQCLALDGQAMGGNLNIGNNQATVTILADCTADKFVKSGGTNIQYLMGDGSTLTQSATSGNSNFYLYVSQDTALPPPPSLGRIRYNNAIQSLVTILYISHTTSDSIDIEVFFNQVNQLNDVYIQDRDNSTNFIKYNITALPTIVPNSYISIPVLAVSSGGTGATSFGPNHNVLLAFFSNLTEVDTRLSTLETKTFNQTAVAGTTTISGTLTANTLSKTAGLPTQFLKADGTVDATTYVSQSGLYNPTELGNIDIMLRDAPFIGIQYIHASGIYSTLSNSVWASLGVTSSVGSTYALTNNFTRQLCCANWTFPTPGDGQICGYGATLGVGVRVSSGFNFGLSAVLGISDTGYNANNCQNFWGCWNIPVTLNQATQLSVQRNMICFGSDTNDPNICIYTAGALSTVKQVDLGASFPANRPSGAVSTDFFKFTLYWEGSTIYYKAVNTTTGVIVSGSFVPLATDMPLTTLILYPQCLRAMGTPNATNACRLQVQRFGVYYN